jgi:hypothetical protein
MGTLDNAAKIATTLASLQPQVAVVMQLVQAGIIGYTSVRAFFKTQGHDDETLDAIIADMQARIGRWNDTTF